MYKLSYEKCVCFIFLVMVAFLSCSGFRIDKLAMTDISKRNPYYTSSPSLNSEFLDRLTSQRTQPIATTPETLTTRDLTRKFRHRIRHSRKHRLEAQATRIHEPNPTSHIETIVFPKKIELETFRTRPTTPIVSEKYAQIPPSDFISPKLTAAIVTRSQRSPIKNNNKQQHKQQQQQNKQQQRNKLPCQEQDVARKAYLANTVVLAKAESMSSNRVRNYSVSFRIVERFKSPPYAVDDNLRLTFLNDTKRMNCESELHGGSHGVIKAQIQQSKEYYLFLNSNGNHNYSVLGMPVLKRKRKKDIDKIIHSVTSRTFEPKLKKPILNNATSTNLQPRSKLKLVCKVRGYPIPVISWRRIESDLQSNNNTRITYSNKGRKSTLVIKSTQDRDSGRYYCVATGVNGQETNAHKDIQISNSNNHGEKCSMKYRETFCQNGGTCFFNSYINEYYCECTDGFDGTYCEKKGVPIHIASMYDKCSLGFPAYLC